MNWEDQEVLSLLFLDEPPARDELETAYIAEDIGIPESNAAELIHASFEPFVPAPNDEELGVSYDELNTSPMLVPRDAKQEAEQSIAAYVPSIEWLTSPFYVPEEWSVTSVLPGESGSAC